MSGKGIRFLSKWQSWMGILLVSLFVLIAIFAPLLAPKQKSSDSSISQTSAFQTVKGLKAFKPSPPGPTAHLGTVPRDYSSHLDIFFTLVWGTRSALMFGLMVGITTTLFGVFIGASSGYLGGSANRILMRITDAFLSFPIIAAVVMFNYILYPSYPPSPVQQLLQRIQIDPLILALILFSWMPAARLTNSIVLQLRNIEYIEAVQALGASSFRIILRHLIPNSTGPSIVLAAKDIGGAVLLQATFTFIGISEGSEWGKLLSIGRKWIIGPGGSLTANWWVFFPVTLTLILFGVGWNLLGDSLNDWLNTRRRLDL